MQVFDAGSRTLLRQLKAHKRAAHVAHFSPDRMHVLSAADDTTVCHCLCNYAVMMLQHIIVIAIMLSCCCSTLWSLHVVVMHGVTLP